MRGRDFGWAKCLCSVFIFNVSPNSTISCVDPGRDFRFCAMSWWQLSINRRWEVKPHIARFEHLKRLRVVKVGHHWFVDWTFPHSLITYCSSCNACNSFDNVSTSCCHSWTRRPHVAPAVLVFPLRRHLANCFSSNCGECVPYTSQLP